MVERDRRDEQVFIGRQIFVEVSKAKLSIPGQAYDRRIILQAMEWSEVIIRFEDILSMNR